MKNAKIQIEINQIPLNHYRMNLFCTQTHKLSLGICFYFPKMPMEQMNPPLLDLLACLLLSQLKFLFGFLFFSFSLYFFSKTTSVIAIRCICACASYTDHRVKLIWLKKGINMFATIRVTFNFGSIMMKGKTRENVMTISVQVNPSFIYHSPVKYG